MDNKPCIKKLSKGILDLKFMKRTKEKAEKQDEDEERQQLYEDQLATLHEGADRVVMISSHFHCMTVLPCRLSFGGDDKEIEKVNEEKLPGIYKVIPKKEPVTEMPTDVSAEEMANQNLGSHHQYSSAPFEYDEASSRGHRGRGRDGGRGRHIRGRDGGRGRGRGRGGPGDLVNRFEKLNRPSFNKDNRSPNQRRGQFNRRNHTDSTQRDNTDYNNSFSEQMDSSFVDECNEDGSTDALTDQIRRKFEKQSSKYTDHFCDDMSSEQENKPIPAKTGEFCIDSGEHWNSGCLKDSDDESDEDRTGKNKQSHFNKRKSDGETPFKKKFLKPL